MDVEEIGKVVSELRQEMAKKDSRDNEKIERLEAQLSKFDTHNQEKALEEKRKENEERQQKEIQESIEAVNRGLTDKITALEAAIALGASHGTQESLADPVYTEQFSEWVHTGLKTEALNTATDNEGGYLVPRELDNEIVKQLFELDPMRAISRVTPINGKFLDVPTRGAIPSAAYVAELAQGPLGQSVYGQLTLTPVRQTVTTPVSQDQLRESNIEAEMTQDAVLSFAVSEGNKFVLGSGADEPEGFLTNTSVLANNRLTAVIETVSASDIISLQGDLEVGFNPVLVLNRKTLAQVRNLQDSQGRFLWEPGLNGPASASLAGTPYFLSPSMPDVASNNHPIAYGDFNLGFRIVDRTQTALIRDDFTEARNAIVKFTWFRWNTSRVVNPQAIRVLRVG